MNEGIYELINGLIDERMSETYTHLTTTTTHLVHGSGRWCKLHTRPSGLDCSSTGGRMVGHEISGKRNWS